MALVSLRRWSIYIAFEASYFSILLELLTTWYSDIFIIQRNNMIGVLLHRKYSDLKLINSKFVDDDDGDFINFYIAATCFTCLT